MVWYGLQTLQIHLPVCDPAQLACNKFIIKEKSKEQPLCGVLTSRVQSIGAGGAANSLQRITLQKKKVCQKALLQVYLNNIPILYYIIKYIRLLLFLPIFWSVYIFLFLPLRDSHCNCGCQ